MSKNEISRAHSGQHGDSITADKVPIPHVRPTGVDAQRALNSALARFTFHCLHSNSLSVEPKVPPLQAAIQKRRYVWQRQ